jgi:hypothetical protein
MESAASPFVSVATWAAKLGAGAGAGAGAGVGAGFGTSAAAQVFIAAAVVKLATF